MRRRLVISTIAIVLVVLGALAVPIGLVVYEAAEQQLQSRLDERASTIASLISTDGADGRSTDFAAIADVLGPNDGLQISDPSGDVAFRYVPPGLDSTRVSTRFASDGSRVRIVTDADPLDDQFREQLSILLLLAVGAIIAAAALAAVQARQLARPLERLATRAARIGDGDFSARSFPPTHIPEIDRIGSSLDTSAERVHLMLVAERHFTADATHQLRTGLAGLAMRFEILSHHTEPDVASEARAGLAQTDQMNLTINELLAVARQVSSRQRSEFDPDRLVHDHVDEWRHRFTAARRQIEVVELGETTPVFGTKGLAGQVLDNLIDNALLHGQGTVTITIDGVSVFVSDEGEGMTPDEASEAFQGPVDPAAEHGRGLSLARRLAQVDGGTLDLVEQRPPKFKLTLVRAGQGTTD